MEWVYEDDTFDNKFAIAIGRGTDKRDKAVIGFIEHIDHADQFAIMSDSRVLDQNLDLRMMASIASGDLTPFSISSGISPMLPRVVIYDLQQVLYFTKDAKNQFFRFTTGVLK